MENLKNKLMENVTMDDLGLMVNEINGWDAGMEHLQIFHMEEFDEILHGKAPFEIVRLANDDFNVFDEYFTFDGYGNLVSYDEYEYHEMLIDEKDDIIDLALEYHENGNINIDVILERY